MKTTKTTTTTKTNRAFADYRTNNREWGFFGTCASEGHADPEAAWNEAMKALTDPKGEYNLRPEDARDLLDATFGRHLADQVVGSTNIARAIAHLGWGQDARTFVRKHINPNLDYKAKTRETTLNDIARRILDLETLETRKSNSLDFHDMAVWTMKEALEAAYEAGRSSVKKAW